MKMRLHSQTFHICFFATKTAKLISKPLTSHVWLCWTRVFLSSWGFAEQGFRAKYCTVFCFLFFVYNKLQFQACFLDTFTDIEDKINTGNIGLMNHWLAVFCVLSRLSLSIFGKLFLSVPFLAYFKPTVSLVK